MYFFILICVFRSLFVDFYCGVVKVKIYKYIYRSAAEAGHREPAIGRFDFVFGVIFFYSSSFSSSSFPAPIGSQLESVLLLFSAPASLACRLPIRKPGK